MRYLSHQEVFNKQFCFIRCRRQQLQAVEKRRYSTFTLLKSLLAICQKSWEPSFWEVIDPFVLLAYASLTASRPFLQWLLACVNFTLDSEDISCWWKWKEWFLWAMVVAKVDENHREDWGLNWYLQWYIHQFQPNPPTKFTSNSRSTEFKDILWWNISQLIPKTVSSSMRIVISYAMKWGIPFWWKVNGNLDNNMIRISQWSKSHCKTYSSIRKKK